MEKTSFIQMLAPLAQTMASTTRIPASFLLAQAALESGWGESKLFLTANNAFGIKADASWTGATVEFPTHEWVGGKMLVTTASWRAYASLMECLTDHASFFQKNPRYRKCFTCVDGQSFARAVAAAGYATDPLYAQKLVKIIQANHLDQYDLQPAQKGNSMVQSSVKTGAVSLANTQVISVVTWLLTMYAGQPVPAEVVYGISVGVMTLAHACYNVAKSRGWFSAGLVPADTFQNNTN